MSITSLTLTQEIIARAPKLETLCLTHIPYRFLKQPSSFRGLQWRHSQLASSILSFLDKLGSPIRFLAFYPPAHGGPWGRVDSDGHTWPRYYYRKAKTVLDEDMDQGAVGVLAMPVQALAFRNLSSWHHRYT
jgi:hypothetical protein